MNNAKNNTTLKYLFWTFLIAWILEIIVGILSKNNQAGIGQLLMTILMFAPMVGVLLSGNSLKGMGWKPKFKGNIKYLLFSWFMPSIITAIGAAIYFMVFPGHFDMTGKSIIASYGEQVIEQLEASGLNYFTYTMIAIASALIYAPLLNMIPSLGEEAGWRGYLYPVLKENFGKKKGLLIGGIIWGIWHWPLIWLIGYEYGSDYPGFPIVGMLVFCIFTTSIGILCDYVYEKSGSIYLPSILHGSINAAATIPFALYYSENGATRLLGPAPNGLLAGIPMIILAIIILKNSK